MNNYCVFNVDRARCTFPRKWPFSFFICPHHLKVVYGIDLFYLQLDGETESKVQGPYLIPALGCPLKANTVVFPTREFVDQVFDMKDSEAQFDHFTFEMNPSIQKFVRDLDHTATQSKGNDTVVYTCRYQYEVLRNLFVESKEANLGQANDRDQFINFKNKLQTNLGKVEVSIDNLPIYTSRFTKVKVKNDNNESKTLKEVVPSRPLRVLLSNCMFDKHKIPTDSSAHLSTIPVNFSYMPHIGWVTLEKVVNPMMFGIEGDETGHVPWYQFTTMKVDKVVKHKNMTTVDMPSATGVMNSLRGASDGCLF